ncbi:3-hydroxyacyl-ACP dehydratase FabZ family protein [Amycolatopsis sp. YIM 10]|uniref:3-hydroxyacyl-ACP dehydratase FabZ family protein n=1 Tax=Amycolatopsis sp. YIM 10 TaxID=2653857 RepID=UPI0012A91B82|nr:3-hydroxyacyl-ACP dehydratase [Amycolatopsis sp. YIM 10]QFU90538.1 3-hydroxyacyl-[acyl-carrier-protein] dehydratase FabZ [Amycolatopsis sp. YIM 10]
MIGPAEIMAIIPHRAPMLLLDGVAEIEPGVRLTAVGTAGAGRNGPELPAGSAYPRELVVEAWAQAAVLLTAWERPLPEVGAGRVMLGAAIDRVRFEREVYSGELLEHRVRLVKAVDDNAVLDGSCLAGGELVAEFGNFLVALRDTAAVRAECGTGEPA